MESSRALLNEYGDFTVEQIDFNQVKKRGRSMDRNKIKQKQ